MATVRGVVALLALGPLACTRAGYEAPPAGLDQRLERGAHDRARADGPADRGRTDGPGAADLARRDQSPHDQSPHDQSPHDQALKPDTAPLGAFSAPVKLTALNSAASDDDPSLTGDELEIYFASYRAGGPGPENIYRSTRSGPSAAWSPPQLVAELNSTSLDCTPRVSLDGLTITFASARSGSFELYVSTRATRSAPWSAPQPLASLGSSADDYGGSLSPSGLTLVFYSDRGGDLDLYVSKRATTGAAWGAPAELSELSTPHEEGGPQLDATEKVLFFFSTRPGGKGGRDLWMATRSSPGALFGTPTPILELNTAGEESDLWISTDLRRIYFGSGSTDLDLHVATR